MNIRYFIFFLLLAVFITTLSGIPSLGSGLLHSSFLNQVIRKSIHIILFSILAILFWQSCPGLDKDIFVKIMVCIMALSLFAGFDEIHQMYVPGRNGNLVGFSFDVVGIVVGLSVMVGRRQKTEDRGQRTEDRGQRTEDGGQRTEDNLREDEKVRRLEGEKMIPVE